MYRLATPTDEGHGQEAINEDCRPGIALRTARPIPTQLLELSGLTITMLTPAVCDEVHKLVTLGFQAESAGDLEAGQRLYVEGLWQAREEGRRELLSGDRGPTRALEAPGSLRPTIVLIALGMLTCGGVRPTLPRRTA